MLKKIEHKVWGSGEKRDFIYVDDLVEMIDKSIKNQKINLVYIIVVWVIQSH